jgi:hypothetical protein
MENIVGEIMPLLEAMEISAEAESIPRDWLERCVTSVGTAFGQLLAAIDATSATQYVVEQIYPDSYKLKCFCLLGMKAMCTFLR